MFREKIVTFGGNLKASHIKFNVGHQDEDDENDEDFESSSDEICPEVKSDNNQSSSDFSDMKLIEFPKSLQARAKNVRYLYLDRNHLTRLPPDLFLDFPQLEWLDVRNNDLTELPRLHSHKRIKTILAENNEIARLPSDLLTARKLTCLQLSNNPLDSLTDEERVALSSGLEQYREHWRGKGKLGQQRQSVDSGVDVTSNDPDKTEDCVDYSDDEEKEILGEEEEEIRHFIVNKELYKCEPLCSEPENFDEFLYFYKSFHSPLLDKEFRGFSMEQIQSESRRVESRKREQHDKKMINDALQRLKNTAALSAWRLKYREFQRLKARRREKGEEEEEEEEEEEVDHINPPFDADPDWTVENSQLEDKIFRPGVDPSLQLSQVERALAVLEAEMDGEVERVIRSAGRPGKHGGSGAVVERRRGRLDRLSSKLETVRNKVRSVSAQSRI